MGLETQLTKTLRGGCEDRAAHSEGVLGNINPLMGTVVWTTPEPDCLDSTTSTTGKLCSFGGIIHRLDAVFSSVKWVC
jgi:hypothetical protein